jgi:hypothetical protein
VRLVRGGVRTHQSDQKTALSRIGLAKCIATSQFDPEQTIFAKPIDATDLN